MEIDSFDPKKRKRENEDICNFEPNKKKKNEILVETVNIDRDKRVRSPKKKRKREDISEGKKVRNTGLGRRVGEKRKFIEDLTESFVCKESLDEESKLQRTIVVSNLTLKWKRKALLKEFGRFGEVESISFSSMSDIPAENGVIKRTKQMTAHSVTAYIVFKDVQSALSALSHGMTQVGEYHVRIDMGCPPCKKMKGENSQSFDEMRTIYMGNLPSDVQEEELYQLFSMIPELKSNLETVHVIEDPCKNSRKQKAYATFNTREAADWIVKKKQFTFRDCNIKLFRIKSGAKPHKRKISGDEWEENDPPPIKKLAIG